MSSDNKQSPGRNDDPSGQETKLESEGGPIERTGERLSMPSAADEPTDVWDEAALKAAGLENLVAQRSANRRARQQAEVTPVNLSRIPAPKMPSTPPTGLSWWLTVLLAVVSGVAVYFFVRFLM